jgi:hypothetical protein
MSKSVVTSTGLNAGLSAELVWMGFPPGSILTVPVTGKEALLTLTVAVPCC